MQNSSQTLEQSRAVSDSLYSPHSMLPSIRTTTTTALLAIVALAHGAAAQETKSREWGTVWGNPSGANGTASYSADVAIESGNGTSGAGQKPVVFAYPMAKDTCERQAARRHSSKAMLTPTPRDRAERRQLGLLGARARHPYRPVAQAVELGYVGSRARARRIVE